MGISERKEREKSEMRELVLKTALKLFIENGYDNVSIRKIANAIEYSPGTIYLYFRDKDEIFFELHDRAFKEFYAYQLSSQNIKDPLERIQAHGMAYVEFALKNPELYDLMFISLIPAKKIKECHEWIQGQQTFDLLKKNVQDCIDAGYYKGSGVDVVAFALWSYVHGIASLIIRERMQLLPKEVIQGLIAGAFQFLEGLSKGSK